MMDLSIYRRNEIIKQTNINHKLVLCHSLLRQIADGRNEYKVEIDNSTIIRRRGSQNVLITSIERAAKWYCKKKTKCITNYNIVNGDIRFCHIDPESCIFVIDKIIDFLKISIEELEDNIVFYKDYLEAVIDV